MHYENIHPSWALIGLDAPYNSKDTKIIKKLLSKKTSSPFIIAADGGCDLISALHLQPDIVIGDMDSISKDKRKDLENSNIPFIIHPREKDKTDSHLALEYAKNSGYNEVVLAGALGGRIDHTLANIHMAGTFLANSPIQHIKLIGSGHEVTIIKSKVSISGHPGETISLIPFTSVVKGVTITGVHYPLDNATLKRGETLGISNYFEDHNANIIIKSGILIIIRLY